MVHLLDLLHQKIELFRLEQRYTRRRNRRSTFVSEAQYVDGEYIYSPTSSYSAKCSAGSSGDSDRDEAESPISAVSNYSGGSGSSNGNAGSLSRASKRFSSMKLAGMDWKRGGSAKGSRSDVVISEREVKWDDSVRRR